MSAGVDRAQEARKGPLEVVVLTGIIAQSLDLERARAPGAVEGMLEQRAGRDRPVNALCQRRCRRGLCHRYLLVWSLLRIVVRAVEPSWTKKPRRPKDGGFPRYHLRSPAFAGALRKPLARGRTKGSGCGNGALSALAYAPSPASAGELPGAIHRSRAYGALTVPHSLKRPLERLLFPIAASPIHL